MRLRLTVFYGCCFLVSGAALLLITYALVADRLSTLQVSTGAVVTGHDDEHLHATSSVADGLKAQQAADLHQLLVQSGIALAIMTVVSIALGWLMAGRTMRPLRTITASTRRISERNLHERLALAGPDDELKDLADTIDGLLARLDAAFDSQRRFVANASHELRTPLMFTQTLLQVALADPEITLDELRATCEEVVVSGKEQARLIQALLTLARSQRGLDHREPLDLAQITGQILDAHKTEAAVGGLRIDAAIDLAPITGDPRLVEILVANLVENAIRYNVPGGRVGIAVADGALTVVNTGPVVATDQVQRLLQPFQRLDRHRGHEHEGLGLGLSIVAAIASAHGAILSVVPQATGGLDISVRFG